MNAVTILADRPALIQEIIRMTDFASDGLLMQLKDWFAERLTKEAEEYEPTVYSEETIQSILEGERELEAHPNPMSFEEFVAHCEEISARIDAEMAFEGAEAVNA